MALSSLPVTEADRVGVLAVRKTSRGAPPPRLDDPPRPDRLRRDRHTWCQTLLVLGVSLLLSGLGILVAWPWSLGNQDSEIIQTRLFGGATGAPSLPTLEQLTPPGIPTPSTDLNVPYVLSALDVDPLEQPFLAVPPTTVMSTTTTRPAPALPRLRKSELFSNVQLTLTIEPPASSAPRTGHFQVQTEFGDARVLLGVAIDFGDGSVVDGEVQPWRCWDESPPNPYLVSGLAHAYSAPGSYALTVTVRTGSCIPGDDDPAIEDSARMELVVKVP